MKLNDNYIAVGTTYESYLEELNEMANKTESLTDAGSNFKILSFQYVDKNGNYVFAQLDRESIDDFNTLSVLKKSILPIREDERPLFEEMSKTSGLVILNDNVKPRQIYLVAKDAIASLADRAGVKGDSLQINSLIRNLYIAQGLFAPWHNFKKNEKREMTLVMRKQKSHFRETRKVFAFMGTRYKYTPINSSRDILSQLMNSHTFGKAKCVKWCITHRGTKLILEFPEEAKKIKKKYGIPIVPGLIISDSDTGRNSFTIACTYSLKGVDTPFIYDSQTWEHTAEIKAKEVVSYCWTTFPMGFNEIVPKIAEFQTNVVDTKKISTFYKTLVKEAQLVKAIGKKRTMAIVENSNKFDKPQSEYNLIVTLAKEAFELKMPDYAHEMLMKSFGSVHFIIQEGSKWDFSS